MAFSLFMSLFSSLLVSVTLLTNVFAGGSLAFSSLWMSHDMSGSSMEYCLLHCLSGAVDQEQLELIVAPSDFLPSLIVSFVIFVFAFAIKRQPFVSSFFIRPDPRLCRLVALRE